MLARSGRLCSRGGSTLDGTGDGPYVSGLEKALRTGRGRWAPRNVIVPSCSHPGSPMSSPSAATTTGTVGPVRLSARATAALRPGIAPAVAAGLLYETRANTTPPGTSPRPELL